MPVAIPPLVGRADEIAHLHGLLRSAAAGAGGLAVITGEPGVGKTRLVEAAATAAAAAGMQVRIGRGVDREVERALGVALDALGLRLDQLVGVSAATRFVLEAGTTAASAFLLADRLLEVVEGLCTTGPVLLAVEDLQWSDTATLAWLRAIAERAAALPLAVLVTTRPVADGTEVGRTLDALGAPVVTVAPLADDEVSALVTGVLGHPPDPALRAALDEVRGNPLLVLAVLERGDGPHGGAGTAALTRRLAELDAAALRTLQFAAVLGLRVDPAALATVVGGLPTDLLTHVEAAAASGVLVPDGDHYVFRHNLYRAAVLSTLTRPARSLLHLHAARSLARAGAPVLDVAEHYAQGARPGDREAVRWLRDAALDIVAAAPAGALRLVDVALDLAGPAPPDDLVLVRVRALAGTGRTAEADLLGGPCCGTGSRRRPRHRCGGSWGSRR